MSEQRSTARERRAAKVAYRYVLGRPLDGNPRGNSTFLRAATAGDRLSAWSRAPGWQRAAWRMGTPVAGVTGLVVVPTHLGEAAALGSVAAARGAQLVRRRWRVRRFKRAYVRPTVAALRPALGEAPLELHIDPSLGQLVPRLLPQLSPAELRVRTWYGAHVEPVVRWLPERAQRGVWAVSRRTARQRRRLDVFKRPRVDLGPRIELTLGVPFLTPEQRNYVAAVIGAKIPAGELVEHWDQVGPRVVARWTVRRRPPSSCGYPDLVARLDGLKEWEFFFGLGVGAKPVTISLADDSPHICLSAGSGAGKSVLAQLIAVQVLARGGQVVILDLKGSHRWALGLPGVDYCTTPEQMHAALIRLAALADQRNGDALHEDEGWDPGPRVLVVAEELNATFTRLKDYWTDIREKGDPKASPAVKAFRNILFMGRSAKVNMLAIAQMLTANTTGGPESRENFGIRCLARYTKNNWQMLAPEAAMPRPSRTLGRWQIVVGGAATETQVCYLTKSEARMVAYKGCDVSIDPESLLMAADQGLSQRLRQESDGPAPLISLRQAVQRGIVPWRYHASRQRLQRARRAGRPTPEPARRDGMTDLYRPAELTEWAEREMTNA